MLEEKQRAFQNRNEKIVGKGNNLRFKNCSCFTVHLNDVGKSSVQDRL